jgi:putative flippase GtrA
MEILLYVAIGLGGFILGAVVLYVFVNIAVAQAIGGKFW